jgi:hypothetical protein
MSDIFIDEAADEEKEPSRVADLRPFVKRLRAAEAQRVRLAEQVAANSVECAAARQEFDDATAKVLDVLIPDDKGVR